MCIRGAVLQKLTGAVAAMSLVFAMPVAIGQPLQEEVIPSTAIGGGDALSSMLAAADAAIEKGDVPSVRRHLERALWQAPHSAAIFQRLLAASENDDQRTLLTHRWVGLLADDRGAYRVDRDLRKLLPKDSLLKKVAAARAQAASELLRFATGKARSQRKRPSDWLLARHAQTIASLVLSGAPALWPAMGVGINEAAAPRAEPWKPVIRALVRLIEVSLENGQYDAALAAARTLIGLSAQSRFPDLMGPPAPDLSSERGIAIGAVGQVRALLRGQGDAPVTVAELRAMDGEQRLRFTEAHTDWSRPAVGITDSGSYRVETTCGHGTLLGALETIEQHHARLAGWFGSDPFKQPGIVRIVPDAAGLEQEGTPHWWAGGFQSGDVTTVRFSAGPIVSLGSLLTHELTHRFDGALNPGLPSWMSEGRAVFTEVSYAKTADTKFVEDYADFGRIEGTWIKGYGRSADLKNLLTGEIDDYRDNYEAGYALFLFLLTYEKSGRHLYRDRLSSYFAACADPKSDEIARFEQYFADGASGRPSGIDGFASAFDGFLKDFYWMTRGPISKRYRDRLFRERGEDVYDFPIWRSTRVRAEPYFGDGLAAEAADLLHRHGKSEDALAAMLWAVQVDEASPEASARLAEQLDQLGRAEAAWVVRAGASGEGDDLLGPLRIEGLKKTRAYAATLSSAAEAYREQGKPLSAAMFSTEHRRLSALIGEALPEIASGDAEALESDPGFPFEGPDHYVFARGAIEDELTDHQKQRVEGLFYETGDGRIHIGRSQARAGTGQLDRTARQRHTFVRGNEWMRGRYRMSGRVHLTTSYVEGTIVAGYSRRDRNIRLTFVAGDFQYSAGAKDEPKVTEIEVRLSGVRDAESSFAGQEANRRFRFDGAVSSFEVELFVDGGLAVAFIDGKIVGTYNTPDDSPIEGYLGFGSTRGAYQMESPTVAEWNRRAAAGFPEPLSIGLHLREGGPRTRSRMMNRQVEGIDAGPEGTVVVWVPSPREKNRAKLARSTVETVRKLSGELRQAGYGASMALVLPDVVTDDERKQIDEALRKSPEVQCEEILIHHKLEPLASLDDAVPMVMSMALVVGPDGVLRAIGPYNAGTKIVPHEIVHWLRLFTRGE